MARLSFLPLPQNERECNLSFQSLRMGGRVPMWRTAMPVKFVATIQMPPGAGKVMNARWEFEGEKDFPIVQEIKPSDVQDSGAPCHAYDDAHIREAGNVLSRASRNLTTRARREYALCTNLQPWQGAGRGQITSLPTQGPVTPSRRRHN